MSNDTDQFTIYAPRPASRADFVKFWATQYRDPNEHLYTTNINSLLPHKPKGLRELFRWKFGHKLFESTLPRVNRYFISRRDKAWRLIQDFSRDTLRDRIKFAKTFLDCFEQGGAIYRIFWLHCWDTQFPLYDQHVHRAMTVIEKNEATELPQNPSEEIELYRNRYLPFFDRFPEMEDRKVDKALWSYGKYLINRRTKLW